MFEVNKLDVRVNGKLIIRDISFYLSPGNCLSIIGPVGAGKTTLLRTIAGLIKPISGIIFKPKNYFYIPQNTLIYPSFSAIGICKFIQCDIEHMKVLANEWNVPLDRKLTELSEGTRRAIFWILASLSNPQLIIADEPWQGTDLWLRELIRNEMINLLSQDKIIILASHELWEIEKICSHIMILHRGTAVMFEELDILKETKRQNLESIYLEVIGGEKDENV